MKIFSNILVDIKDGLIYIRAYFYFILFYFGLGINDVFGIEHLREFDEKELEV